MDRLVRRARWNKSFETANCQEKEEFSPGDYAWRSVLVTFLSAFQHDSHIYQYRRCLVNVRRVVAAYRNKGVPCEIIAKGGKYYESANFAAISDLPNQGKAYNVPKPLVRVFSIAKILLKSSAAAFVDLDSGEEIFQTVERYDKVSDKAHGSELLEK